MAVDKREPVRWALVIGGILLAWFIGAFVAVFLTMASAALFDHPPTAVLIATVAVGLFYVALYRLMRRNGRDMAVGLLIGGCMVTLMAGACGALLTNLQAH